MIAYRAVRPAAISTVDHEEDTVSSQPILRPDAHTADSVTDATPPLLPSKGDAPLVSIIDPRNLSRDSLARALEATESRFRSHTFACLGDWLQNEQIREETVAVLLGIGVTDADDPGLVEDLQLLAREFGHIPTIVMGDVEELVSCARDPGTRRPGIHSDQRQPVRRRRGHLACPGPAACSCRPAA